MILSLWRYLITDPWREADDRYLPDSRRYRGLAVTICVTAALILTLIHFFGYGPTFRQLKWFRLRGPYAPGSYWVYWSGFRLFAYVLLPVLAVRFFTPISIREMGIQFKGWSRHWLLYLGLFFLVLPPVIAVSFMPEFVRTYPFFKMAGRSVEMFIFWELFYALQFFALEFFFRGFMIHTLKYAVGAAAVPIMVIPYCMIHFPKPLPECLGSIVAGLVLGMLSLKTGRIWGGVLIHVAVAVTMDVLALVHQGILFS